MICVGENEAIICKGDFEPAAIYKGDTFIAGAKNTTFEGELISVENTYNAPIEIEVSGKTEQDVSVRGKNLFDKSIKPTFFNEYAVFTELDSGFKVSKSAIGQWSCVRIPVIEDASTFAGQDLILSFDAVVINGTLSAFNVYLMIDTNDTTDRITLKSMTSSINNISSNYKLQFTLPSVLGNTKMLVFQPYADTSQNTADGYTEYTNVQLELGSTATDYEPFVPDSPSPNYPSDIQKVLSGTNVNVVGKNLINFESWLSSITAINRGTLVEKTNDSITITSTGEDCYTNNAYGLSAYFIDVLPSTTYTFSYKKQNSTLGNAYIFFCDNLSDTYQGYINAGQGVTFTTPSYCTRISFRLGIAHLGYTETFYEPQLELGSTTTTYQPYQSGGSLTVPCDLYEGDECQWLADKTEVTKAKGVKIFDGTEGWTLISNGDTTTLFRYGGFTDEVDGAFREAHNPYNSHFQIDDSSYSSEVVGQTGSSTSVGMYLRVPNSIATTAAALQQWLASQYAAGTPVTIVYELAETQTVEYDAQTIPNSVPRHTNIYSIPETDGLKPNIKTTMKTY